MRFNSPVEVDVDYSRVLPTHETEKKEFFVLLFCSYTDIVIYCVYIYSNRRKKGPFPLWDDPKYLTVISLSQYYIV